MDNSVGGYMATCFEKIWNNHVITEEGDDAALLYIDAHLIHEVTSPQAFSGLRIQNRKVRRPDLTYGTMDHNTPTVLADRYDIKDVVSKNQLETLAANCKEFNIELHDMFSDYNAIIHMLGPELGVTLPGKTIVCGDSHTATHGAFGAIAFGIGTSEVEHVLATSTLWQKKPKMMGVKITGKLQPGVYAKDIILAFIRKYGVAVGNGYAFEFYGDTISNMSMDERMTICNMAIEAGGKSGIIAPDEKTFAYIKDKKHAPKGEEFERMVQYYKTLVTDSESDFDKIVTLDASSVAPQVTWGTNPSLGVGIDEILPESSNDSMVKAYGYMGLKPGMKVSDIPLSHVFIGSCTNGRYSDLKDAAELIKGRKVAPNITAVVVPGSTQVKKACEEAGIADLFIEAGFQWREAGCSSCLGMNPDLIPEFEHCAATSNRNFEGRQGKNSRTHLVSPAMATLAAILGHFGDTREEA